MQTINRERNDGNLFKLAMLAGGVFLLWRGGRAFRGLAWGAFGLAWAAHWSGGWPW